MKFNSLFKCLILALLAFTILPLSSFAAEFSVGVSPSLLDAGVIERGSSKILSFYVVTVSEEELLVQLSSMEGKMDFFDRVDYKDLIFNYSEQECNSWVEFLRNPVEIKPTGETLETKGGGIIRGWTEVNLVVNIPENADPGYHNLMISPVPFVTSDVEGRMPIAIRAVIDIPVLFQVPGTAIRKGSILDVGSGNYDGNRLEINTFFENTGTVTVSARAEEIKIYDKHGKHVETLRSNLDYVKPGETVALKSFLDVRNLDLGEYDVIANVSYKTGYASKESMIVIYEKPAVAPPTPSEELPEFPLWLLIILVIIIITYMIYRRTR